MSTIEKLFSHKFRGKTKLIVKVKVKSKPSTNPTKSKSKSESKIINPVTLQLLQQIPLKLKTEGWCEREEEELVKVKAKVKEAKGKLPLQLVECTKIQEETFKEMKTLMMKRSGLRSSGTNNEAQHSQDLALGRPSPTSQNPSINLRNNAPPLLA